MALAIVAVAVSMSIYLIDAFRISRDATQTGEETAYLGRILSELRSDWRDSEAYETAELPELTPPAGTEARFEILSDPADTLRTVTLTLTDAQNSARSLSTQIVRPLPETEP